MIDISEWQWNLTIQQMRGGVSLSNYNLILDKMYYFINIEKKKWHI